MPRISPMVRSALFVGDLDKSRAFYRDVIGMTKTGEFDVAADFGAQVRLKQLLDRAAHAFAIR